MSSPIAKDLNAVRHAMELFSDALSSISNKADENPDDQLIKRVDQFFRQSFTAFNWSTFLDLESLVKTEMDRIIESEETPDEQS
jgi:hypothetical protein